MQIPRIPLDKTASKHFPPKNCYALSLSRLKFPKYALKQQKINSGMLFLHQNLVLVTFSFFCNYSWNSSSSSSELRWRQGKNEGKARNIFMNSFLWLRILHRVSQSTTSAQMMQVPLLFHANEKKTRKWTFFAEAKEAVARHAKCIRKFIARKEKQWLRHVIKHESRKS